MSTVLPTPMVGPEGDSSTMAGDFSWADTPLAETPPAIAPPGIRLRTRATSTVETRTTVILFMFDLLLLRVSVPRTLNER
jgi:hypothetical protein